MTLSEVGAVMGLSRERIRQIEVIALLKIKARAPWLLDYMIQHGTSPAQACIDAAEVHDVNWRELRNHLRRRFRELGWDR